MTYYLALVFEAPEGGFDFVCPDIPGFTAYAAAREFDEAVAVAREVLASHLALVLDGGSALPPARDLVALRDDPALREDFDEAVTTIMLPVLLPAGRARRVNLSLDENTLALIDSSARDRGLTRSAFVAEACRHFVTGGPAGDRAAASSPTKASDANSVARGAGTNHGGGRRGRHGAARAKGGASSRRGERR